MWARPVILTEFGADTVAGLHGNVEDPAFGHGISGVKREVHEDLLYLVSVHIEHREVRLEFLDNPDVLERSLLFDEADGPFEQGMDPVCAAYVSGC